MKKQTSFIQNEKGIALVMVLLILTVMTILGLALIGLTLNNMKMSSGERSYQSTYYIAESGVTYTMDRVNKNIVNLYNDSTDKGTFFSKIDEMVTLINNEPAYRNFEEAFGHTPEAKISITKIGNNDSNASYRDYQITSIGTIDNRSRTVEKQIRISWINKTNIEIPHTAVFVKEKIEIGGNATIVGDIGTNSTDPKLIDINKPEMVSGKVYVGPESSFHFVNNIPVEKLTRKYRFDIPQFPMFPDYPFPTNSDIFNDGSLYLTKDYTLNLQQDLQFKVINIGKDNTLNIDVGNSNRNIVVDDLNVNGGKLNIIGTGKLTVYVKNDINLGANDRINSTDKDGNVITNKQAIKEKVKKLDIFYKGQKDLRFTNGQRIYGSLIVQDIEIEMLGQSGFEGFIISAGDRITINGDNKNELQQFIYAPNAHVDIGNIKIEGTIISKSFSSNGGDLTLSNYNVDELPLIIGGVETISPKDILSAEPTREK
ncbi:pilus assembly PilX N-terminal domain-containing protein [Bacillus sp. JJ1566]|uniref:pilus assembly PilX N-terminal domain-containing protein n=1 Tax=Bacillus sp. JJ1566 TaxID=3122961 RepID=UPI002FFF8EC5